MLCMFYRVMIAVNQIVFRYLIGCSRYIISDTDNLSALRPIRFITTTNSEYSTTWILLYRLSQRFSYRFCGYTESRR